MGLGPFEIQAEEKAPLDVCVSLSPLSILIEL